MLSKIGLVTGMQQITFLVGARVKPWNQEAGGPAASSESGGGAGVAPKGLAIIPVILGHVLLVLNHTWITLWGPFTLMSTAMRQVSLLNTL